jgi:hypothetical protein
VRRSLDSMMGAALSFNYSEGPRLVLCPNIYQLTLSLSLSEKQHVKLMYNSVVAI